MTSIIHDIFTSGALPPSLLTMEAWTDVKTILAENGVLAVNFVGLIDSKLAQAVFTTLQAVFPYCRAFVEGQHSDPYKNIVSCSVSFVQRPCSHDVRSPSVPSRVGQNFEQLKIQTFLWSSADGRMLY